MLSKFLGQRDALKPLIVALEARQVTGKPLPHALFLGRAGTGKTTLAKMLADEMDVPFVSIHAPSIRDAHGKKEQDQMIQHIMSAKGGILHIDEIHALSRTIAESIYQLIDTGKVYVTARRIVNTPIEVTEWIDDVSNVPPNKMWIWNQTGKGYYNVIRMVESESKEFVSSLEDVSPITIIGSTTDEALMPQPLLSRLSALTIRLREYTDFELGTIARFYGRDQGCTIWESASEIIAARSRGIPRRVEHLTARAIDYAVSRGKNSVDAADVLTTMDFLGVDEYGLEQPHRVIMDILKEHKNGLSRTSLAQILGIPIKNMEAHWADLTRAGFVTISTRHTLTEKGRKLYD